MSEESKCPFHASTTVAPTFPDPLITEPSQPSVAPHVSQMGPLQYLVGTWTNQDLADGKPGGTLNPFSYNIMPLPSFAADAKYILKNFKYYEEITFSPITGNAPNRGGDYQQNANVLFYEQRIYFADGPNKNGIVHAENGTWLFLETSEQSQCPYNPEPIEPHGEIPSQPISTNIAKQISVPHGNSILVQGAVDHYTGPGNADYIQSGDPRFPDYTDQILPIGVDTTPYTTQSVGNPFPALNTNPNKPLQDADKIGKSNRFISWGVDSKNAQAPGHITNIPFEAHKARVVDYSANYWLESYDSGASFTRLSYNQTIVMNLPIQLESGLKVVAFPHITCNVLTKKS
jgi:hypothetical protein